MTDWEEALRQHQTQMTSVLRRDKLIPWNPTENKQQEALLAEGQSAVDWNMMVLSSALLGFNLRVPLLLWAALFAVMAQHAYYPHRLRMEKVQSAMSASFALIGLGSVMYSRYLALSSLPE